MRRAEQPRLERLGDQGVLATFSSEARAAQFAAALRATPLDWVVDVVTAYVTVAVFHDPDRISLEDAIAELSAVRPVHEVPASRLHLIPCCYERGPDLERVAAWTGLTAEEVIRLHASVPFTVYAIGFCPGFPYLGYLPPALCGVPRLEKPRLRVQPGSVGLTGRQTGVYPLPRPGGWNLIGQTPLELVNVEKEYFPIRAGDQVQFVRIDESEYTRLQGERLPASLAAGGPTA